MKSLNLIILLGLVFGLMVFAGVVSSGKPVSAETIKNETAKTAFELSIKALPADITGPANMVRIDWNDNRTLVNDPLTGRSVPAPDILKQAKKYMELKQKIQSENRLWYYMLTFNFFESGGGK